MDENIVNKLKKLLTLSKGATGAEADSAMEKAVALAAKHNIDLACAIVSAPIKEEFVEGEAPEGKQRAVTTRFISRILRNHFNVRVIMSGSRYCGMKNLILGRKSDVEFALYVNDFLKEHMTTQWKMAARAHKLPASHRATFFESFSRGLSSKLNDAKKKQEEETFSNLSRPADGTTPSAPSEFETSARNRYALILQDEVRDRDLFVEKKYPGLRTIRTGGLANYGGSAASAGFNSGYTTNIARPLKGALCLQ
jgi:hypothetical protein